jgi:hypothetical protein
MQLCCIERESLNSIVIKALDGLAGVARRKIY